MEGLDFITDAKLRKRIEDSVEFAYALHEEAKGIESVLFQEETYRVIILYMVAVIEAILLYLYKKDKDDLTFLEYKFVQTLPTEYHHESNNNFRVVVAVQVPESKKDHQIGMIVLIQFFKEKKILKPKIAKGLADINNLRNTFHLCKPRDAILCDVAQAESAFKLLLEVIKVAPQAF